MWNEKKKEFSEILVWCTEKNYAHATSLHYVEGVQFLPRNLKILEILFLVQQTK